MEIPQNLPGGCYYVSAYVFTKKLRKGYNIKTYFVGKNEKGKFKIVDYVYESCDFTSLEELKKAVMFVMNKGLFPEIRRFGDQ